MRSKVKKILLIGNKKSFSPAKIKIIENDGYQFVTAEKIETIDEIKQHAGLSIIILDTEFIPSNKLNKFIDVITKEFFIPLLFITGEEDNKVIKRLKKTEPLWIINKKSDGHSALTVIKNALVFHELQLKQKDKEKELVLRVDNISTSLNAANIGVWDWDVVNNVLVWNDNMYKVYGIKPNSFSGAFEAWEKGLHPEDRERATEELRKALTGEKEFFPEFRILWPDKSVHYIKAAAVVRRDHRGKPVRMIGANWDITPQKLAEEEQKKEKNIAQSYLDIAGVMIVALNKKGDIILINKKGCEILGYTESEVLNKNWFELFLSGEEKETVKNIFTQLIRGKVKGSEYHENAVLSKNKEKRIIAFHNSILKDSSGKITGILFSGEDITVKKKIEEELRQSEQKFHSMFEYHKAIMMLIDPADGRIIDANRSAARFYGYSRKKLSAMNISEINTLSKVELERLIEMIRQDKQSCFVATHKLSDGEERVVEVYSSSVNINKQKLLFSIIYDVTDRNAAESALIENRKNLRAILDASTESVFMIDTEGKVLAANETTAKRLNYKLEDLIGKKILEVIPEKNVDYRRIMLQKAIEAKEAFVFEDKMGSLILEHHVYPVISQGKVDRLAIYVIDITARRKAEEELALFFNVTLDMLCIASFDGYFTKLNPVWSKTLGWTNEELMSKPFIEFVHPDDRESTIQAAAELTYGNKVVGFDNRYLCADGTYKWISWNSFADLKRNIIIAAAHDISARKQAEENLKLSQSNLLSLIESTNDMIWFVDKNFKVVVYNSNLKKLLKNLYGTEVSVGTSPEEVLPGNRVEYWRPMYEKGMREGAFRQSIEIADGKILELFFNQVINDNEVIGISVFAKDITERYRSENALRESEENLRGILNASTESVLLIDLEGKVITANETAAKRFDLETGDFIGKNIFYMIQGGVAETRRVWIKKVIESGRSVRFEDKRGDLWLENQMYPVFSGGIVTRIAVYSIDISKRKMAEEALFNSMQMIEFVFNNMPQRVFWKDKNLKFLGCNKAFAQDAGLSNPEEIIGKDDFQLAWKECAELYRADDRSVIGSGIGKYNFEEPQLYDDGTRRWLVTNKIPLINQSGEILGVLGTYEDITERKEREQILRELSDKLQLALTSAEIGIWDYDIAFNFLSWDDQIFKIYGMKKENFDNTNVPWEKILHPDDRQRLQYEFQQAINGAKELNTEFRIIRFDKDVRIIKTTAIVQRSEDGSPVRIIGLNYDITEQRLYEKEISLNERRINSLYQLSQMVASEENDIIEFALEEGVNLTESFGGYLHFVNPDNETLRLFTWSNEIMRVCKAEKAEKYPISEAGVWADCFRLRKPVIHNDYQNLADKKGYPEGHFHLVRHMSIPIFEGDRIIAIAGVGNKLTNYTDSDVKQFYIYMNEMWKVISRKHAEKALAESEERFRSIFTSANTGIVFTDSDGKIIFTNKAFEEIIGYSAEELKEQSFSGFTHPEDLELDLNYFKKVHKNEVEQFRLEKRYITKSKEIKWVDLSVSVIRSEDLKPVFFVGVMNDISRQKKIRDELVIAKEEAVKANRAKSTFLANMSHEIRTPMNAIIGFTDLMLSKIEDQKFKSFLTSIKTSGKALLTLINDILDLSKIEAGKMEIHSNAVSLPSFLEEIRQMFILKTNEKRLELFIEQPENFNEMLMIDELRFKQIMLNIVGNSVKFTEKGHIKISVSLSIAAAGKYNVCVSVEDTGIGIPQDAVSSIFDSFSQVDSDLTKKHEGTGLGLTITKKLVEMMNGTISVESVLGKGSTFTITFFNVHALPSNPDEIEMERKDEWEDVIYEDAAILIVDDIESNRNLLKELLANKNLNLIEAENGAEAVLFAKEYLPDLVLMDIRMPVMDGFQASLAIKEEFSDKIPIIAVSASTLSNADIEMMNRCFDGYINKPIKMESLFRQLNNFLKFRSPGKMDLMTEKNEEIADLQQLIETLKNDLVPEWEKAAKTPDLQIIEEFAMNVEKTGKHYNSNMLINYGKALCDSARNIDIENAQKLLKKFTELVQTLTRSGE